MGKKSSSKSDRDSAPATVALPFLAKSNDVAFDPTLTSLFEQSAGPVQTPSFLHVKEFLSEKKFTKRRSEEDEEAAVSSDESSVQGESEDQDEDENGSDVSSMTDASDAEAERKDDALPVLQEPGRKRKRKSKEEETLEDAYFKKLAQRELKDDDEAKKVGAKRRKVVAPLGEEDSASSSDGDGETVDEEGELDSDSNTPLPPPVHETISKDHEKAALDRSQRTIFVSNVSIEAIKSKSAKKALMAHFSSFIPSLPKADVTHKIESIRFRSVAFSDTSLPKRAAYAKKEIMDSTTQSTNAYVVYSTHAAARKAPAVLNGSIVLGRHVRVDSVAHPAPVDHKRCVFVGNLAFVDKENAGDSDDDDDEEGKKKKKRKKKETPPADVEEGLWRTFNEHCKTKDGDENNTHKHGPVESVRVIRDRNTRIGKGFAYVQFYNPNSVEAALTLNGKKFPPLLPRQLRVTRARNIAAKNKSTSSSDRYMPPAKGRGAQQQATMRGRASRLLGRAGASKMAELKAAGADAGAAKVYVFEGHRASEKGGNDKLKMKVKSRGAKSTKSKTKGKPKNRSAKRAAAYKAKTGGK